MDKSTFEIVSAGDHCDRRISRQMLPFLLESTISVGTASVLWTLHGACSQFLSVLRTSSFPVAMGRLLSFASGSDKSYYTEYILLPPHLRTLQLKIDINVYKIKPSV